MNEAEYAMLKLRLAAGEKLPVLEQFLFEQETKRRAEPPNALQQAAQERRANPLHKQEDS